MNLVCMFDKFHLTLNFKSRTSPQIFKKKQNICHLASTLSSKMSPQCHMPSNNTCHFNLWHVFFFPQVQLHVKFHIVIVIVNWRAFFEGCKFLRAKCQLYYTLTRSTYPRPTWPTHPSKTHHKTSFYKPTPLFVYDNLSIKKLGWLINLGFGTKLNPRFHQILLLQMHLVMTVQS